MFREGQGRSHSTSSCGLEGKNAATLRVVDVGSIRRDSVSSPCRHQESVEAAPSAPPRSRRVSAGASSDRRPPPPYTRTSRGIAGLVVGRRAMGRDPRETAVGPVERADSTTTPADARAVPPMNWSPSGSRCRRPIDRGGTGTALRTCGPRSAQPCSWAMAARLDVSSRYPGVGLIVSAKDDLCWPDRFAPARIVGSNPGQLHVHLAQKCLSLVHVPP